MTTKKAAPKKVSTTKPLAGWSVIHDTASFREGLEGSDYVKIIAKSGDKVLVALRHAEAERLVTVLREAGAGEVISTRA